MAELNKLGIFISAFIAIILGMVLIGVLADNIWANTNIATAGNETVALASDVGQLSNEDVITLSSFVNHSHVFVVDVDINYTTAGVLDGAANFTDGNYYAVYTFYPTEYVSNGTARTLLSIIIIFFAIAIIALAVGTFVEIGKGILF